MLFVCCIWLRLQIHRLIVVVFITVNIVCHNVSIPLIKVSSRNRIAKNPSAIINENWLVLKFIGMGFEN